jgi:LysM repeat protein
LDPTELVRPASECAQAWKKLRAKYWKGKPRIRARHARRNIKPMLARQICWWQGFGPMKLTVIFCATLVLAFRTASAETPAPEPAKAADASQLEALAKKIDEQNAKIDALSQEILKLEQQLSHIRPGIMIGESTPSPASPAAAAASLSHLAAGNTHIVARGETLTSIAKMYKVTVDELQKANHIEDGRKLQAGQTISIPTSATPTPTPAG